MAELEVHTHHGEHGENPLVIPVSLTMSILAVLVAVATLFGHRAHTEELLLQAQATDQLPSGDPNAVIVPLHTDGWAHFRQNREDLRASFDTLGFGSRLRLLEPGVATVIEPLCHA